MELIFGSDHADSNCLALALWVLQYCLFCVFFRFEEFRQRRELSTDVFEQEPPLNDFGHAKFIARVVSSAKCDRHGAEGT